ncbi:MAG: hypothetical protein JRC77_10615 [Deltaproteobacteria bacterium]|nr:hypothetical protein [Deltaproteobacteria bacterium]
MTLESTSPLQRHLNLPLLVLYGLGTTVEAGIYALTGKVAGQAGMLAPSPLPWPSGEFESPWVPRH